MTSNQVEGLLICICVGLWRQLRYNHGGDIALGGVVTSVVLRLPLTSASSVNLLPALKMYVPSAILPTT